MSDYGVVVIGRNEAGNLPACFESVTYPDVPVVYVDSGSTDNSVEIAKVAGVNVISLDKSKPFTAARGRNKGFNFLLSRYSDLKTIQFIDGDCRLIEGWMDIGFTTLTENNDVVAVVGHLKEMHPGKSDYNLMCSLEWRSTTGDITTGSGFGGISMIRVSAFQELGGFNPNMIAGEEPDLQLRSRLAGYRILKLDTEMALHDAELVQFSQWWKRAVRGGKAIGHRVHLASQYGVNDMKRELKSTWFWGFILPLVIVIGIVPTNGLSLFLTGGYLILFYRIYTFRIKSGDTQKDSLVYAKYTLLTKFANMAGLMNFYTKRIINKILTH